VFAVLDGCVAFVADSHAREICAEVAQLLLCRQRDSHLVPSASTQAMSAPLFDQLFDI
jgi:hypothetical protein